MPSPTQILGSWLIGVDPASDIVVRDPTVSSQHCRLFRYTDSFALEDLGSTNGTYVDGVRLAPRRPTVVTRQQRITLGMTALLPWPDAASEIRAAPTPGVIRIGRSPDSDIVLDYPMISWEHARIIERGGQHVIEDLGSSNGTALNEVRNRISRAALVAGDDVYLGSLKIPASRLLSDERVVVGEAAFESVTFAGQSLLIGRDAQCDHRIDHPMVSWHHARLSRTAQGLIVEDLGSLNGTFVDGRRITASVAIVAGQEIEVGGVRFQLLESGALHRRDNQGNVSIQAVDVVVTTPGGSRLLDPISLTVYPSELVALMGPAGAGKTTFLKALNGYTPPSQGHVLFNGADLYQSYDLFRQQMGYVPQDDIVHAELTVREALYFCARLRTDLSDAEIDERTDTILEALGILDKKHSLIGSPERKVLSGGQRKRVNIALELISDTPVLFLDEPTSGLSSYDAAGVVDLLKRLSLTGKTIVATIHQPSVDVFRKFDNLIMISRDAGGCGALAYFGPAYPDSIQFFHDQPAATAPARGQHDDMPLSPEMLLTGLASATTSEWSARFAASRYRQQFVDDRAREGSDRRDASQTTGRRFGFRQWLTVTRRSLLLKMRDRAQLVILLLQAPLFGSLIVMVFGRIRNPAPMAAAPALVSPEAMQSFAELGANLLGIHFLMVVAAIWFGCNNAARDIVGEWTIFQRERMVNLKLPSYVFSKFTIMVGLCLLQCLALLTIVHVACNLQGHYWQSAAVLMLSSLVGAALGLAISARSSTTESAIALLPVVLLPVIALGGGIRAIYKIPEPARTLSAVVPSRWALEFNLIDEAAARPCGYLPGGAPWDACPHGGRGVDAATAPFPEAVAAHDEAASPAPRHGSLTLRHAWWQSVGALGAMLFALLGSVLIFLKRRDIH
ncbi:MAG: FHA domain-containing protein [Vicinamibacterales bacterium]